MFSSVNIRGKGFVRVFVFNSRLRLRVTSWLRTKQRRTLHHVLAWYFIIFQPVNYIVLWNPNSNLWWLTSKKLVINQIHDYAGLATRRFEELVMNPWVKQLSFSHLSKVDRPHMIQNYSKIQAKKARNSYSNL